MQAKVTLTILGGALDGTAYAFDKPTKSVVIGRGEDCLVQLPNRGWDFKMVSRHHCKLDINLPHVSVRDLGSRNGTYVNGELIGLRSSVYPLEPAAARSFGTHDLRDGDILAAGPVQFLVNLKSAVKANGKAGRSAVDLKAPEAQENIEPTAEAVMFAI